MSDGKEAETRITLTPNGTREAYIGHVTSDNELIQCQLQNGNYRLARKQGSLITYRELPVAKVMELLNWQDQSSSILREDEFLFSVSDQHGYAYTHLNQANIESSLEEIREIYRYIGTPDWQQKPLRTLSSLVIYTPERKAQHLIRALVATMFKFQNSEEFLEVSEPLIKKIEPSILAQRHVFEGMKSLAHEKATQTYADYQKGIVNSLTQSVKNICDAIDFKRSLSREKLLPKKYTMLVIKILTHDLYKDAMKQALLELIEPYLISLRNENPSLRELDLHHPHQQYTQINIGAPATGKSYLMKKTLLHFNMAFSDFANISPDRFRLPLLKDPCLGKNRAAFGSLTHEEARVQFDEAVQCIQNGYAMSNKKPHIFIERMNIDKDEILLATQNGGKLRVSVTHYPIDKAIAGNHERFLKTQKRKVPIITILSAFKSVSESIPKILKEYKQDIVYYLFDMDKMMGENVDKPGAFIARIDCKDKTVLVRNIEQLISFQTKALLNVEASNPEQLYPRDICELSHFIKSYEGATLLFVNPACDSIQADALRQNVYARYSTAKGFEIIDNQVMEQVIKESAVTADLFSKLGLVEPLRLML